jgi:hypothetical protein
MMIMEESTTEIENVNTHKIIGMVMDGVGEGFIESSKAIEAVKYLMSLDSRAENFVAKPEVPEVQTFLDNANAYAKDNGCHIIELRGFSIAKDDGSSADRADISAVAKIYRCLPIDYRFKGFDRAASSLLVEVK